MSLFKVLFVVAALAVTCVRALPANGALAEGPTSLVPPGVPVPNTEGYTDGFYYLTWTDGVGKVAFTNGPGGQFGLNWTTDNYHVTVGKGWNPGSRDRIINYKGSYFPNGGGCSLWVNGWTTNPLTEYYIVDFATGEGPVYSGALIKGSITCDGAKYDVRLGTRYDIYIDGVRTPVKQFWSVRNPKKQANGDIKGTHNTTCHFEGWKKFGMELGINFDYQILALDNYYFCSLIGSTRCYFWMHGWKKPPDEYFIVDYSIGERAAFSAPQVKGNITYDGAKYNVRLRTRYDV